MASPVTKPDGSPGAEQDLLEGLLESYETGPAVMQHVNSYELPSTEEVARILEQTRALIFPGFVGRSLARATPTELRDHVRERIDELRNSLRRQIYRGLHHKKQSEQGTRDLDCPHCAALKRRLADESVDYTEIDVALSPRVIPELLKLTGGRRVVPVLVDRGEIHVAPEGGTRF